MSPARPWLPGRGRPPAPPRLAPLVAALALALALLWLYWPAVSFETIFLDDPVYFENLGLVRQGLTWDGVVRAFGVTPQGIWIPITLISLMGDVSVFGFGPAGFHGVNILLHALNMALLFLVLRRMTGAFGRSFAAASLVALHPLRVESVAWIVERKDVLAVFFGLLAVAAYLRFLRARGRPWYFLVLLFFALGLMAKPVLVTLPLLLLICDFWPLGRWGRGGGPARAALRLPILEKLPLLGLALAASVVTLAGHRQILRYSGVDVMTRLRIGNLPLTTAHYLKKTFFPAGLHLEFGRGLSAESHPTETILAAALLALLTAGLIRWRTKGPWLLAGWLWFLTALLPNGRVLATGWNFFTRGDRHTYLPHVGLAILLAWGAGDLGRRRWRGRAAPAVLLGLWCVFGALTRTQLATWRDSVTLLRRALSVEPGETYFHWKLGEVLLQRGDTAQALAEAQLAIGSDPGWASPHRLLGFLQAKAGRTEEAVASYEKALGLPDLIDPDEGERADATHFEFAQVLDAAGRTKEALDHYLSAVGLKPGSARYRLALAGSFSGLGRFQEAVEQYRAYLDLETDARQAARGRVALGKALRSLGRGAAAVAEYRTALSTSPDLVDAWFDLGVALLEAGDTAGALVSYREALKRAPRDIPTLLNLAEILFESGQLAEARARFGDIVSLYPAAAEGAFALGRIREIDGDGKGAAECYRRVAAAPPAYPDSAAALRRILGIP